jgi:hypothetical protein
MNRRSFMTYTLASAAGVCAAAGAAGRGKTTTHDLRALAEGARLKVFNRVASGFVEGARRGARLSEAPGDGVAYLEGVELSDGAIEFEVRGRDVQGRSFVGVAFAGVDGATYEAVYFRPFNFRAEDPLRHSHAVQYISHPAHTWKRLRDEQPGRFEQPVEPPPDPNGWFRARVVVAGRRVSVFVGAAATPSLSVERLSDRKSGRVGLWVGDNSPGDFSNMKIVRA